MANLAEHKEGQCSWLQEVAACETVRNKFREDIQDVEVLMFSSKPRASYLPIRNLQSWKEYFDFSENSARSQVTNDFKPISDNPGNITCARLLKIGSDVNTTVLTIWAGLEHALPDLAYRTELTLHLVGTTDHEYTRGPILEELLHVLPKLKRLVVGYVGKDFVEVVSETGQPRGLKKCQDCASAGKTFRMFGVEQIYHEFCDDHPFALEYPADMIVAFHPQFTRGPSPFAGNPWYPTLQRILALRTPTLFTAYSQEECQKEWNYLAFMNADWILAPQKNKWRSHLPYLEAFEARKSEYYHNHWWHMVRGYYKGP